MGYKTLFTNSKGEIAKKIIIIQGISSYCGGTWIGDASSPRGDDLYSSYDKYATIKERVALMYMGRANNYFRRLYISEANPSFYIKQAMQDLATMCKKRVKVLQQGDRSWHVVLPTKFSGEVPALFTEEQGRVLQDIVEVAHTYKVKDDGTLVYSRIGGGITDIHAITNTSRVPVGVVSPRKISNRNIYGKHGAGPFRLNNYSAHASLPWFCPVHRKYDLQYRLAKMVSAMKQQPDLVLVFDHWDLYSTSSARLHITIHELYHMQQAGIDSIDVGTGKNKRTMWFNVFMPLGVNPNYKDHATSGMALSLTGPITFEPLKEAKAA